MTPGNKYRFIFTGKTNGSGAQNVYHCLLRHCLRLQHGSVSGQTYTDLLGNGSITSTLTPYTYDWVCPAGVTCAAVAIYENASPTAPLLYTSVSCQVTTWLLLDCGGGRNYAEHSHRDADQRQL